MPAEILVFDAASSNADGTSPGTALNVGPGTLYGISAAAFPQPPQTVQYASSSDTEGSVPASRKHENRVITVTIICTTLTALRALQAKIGKIAREGGTLKWFLPDGTPIIFDLYSADTFDPTIDITYYKNQGAYGEVQLTLGAAPYGRGPEITSLSDHVETSLPWVTFTETTIKGDWYGLARLVIDNDEAATSMRWAAWGIQSRNYSAASTAALYYEAEACALVGGSLAVGPAGASGGGSNTVFFGTLDVTPATIMYLGASSTAQTHVGSYRVFARVQAPTANVGIVSLNINWLPYTQSVPVANAYVPISLSGVALENQWVMVDLGLVTLPKVRKGAQEWLGYINATSTVLNDDLYIDWIALVPVDEGYGEMYVLTSTTLPLVGSAGNISLEARWDGAIRQNSGGTSYATADVFEGDNLLIPPSAQENRTLRVTARFSRHIPLRDGRTVTVATADVVGDVSAKLNYTPRYLVVPDV